MRTGSFFDPAPPAPAGKERPRGGAVGRGGLWGGVGLREEALRRAVAQLALTGRQAEIVRGVFSGGTEGSIASDAGVSTNTEHTHRRRIFQKLRVHTTSALILRLFGQMLAAGIPPCLGLSPACPELRLAAVADFDGRRDESGRRPPVPAAAVLSDAAWVQVAASLRLTERELDLVHGVFDEKKADAMAADVAVSLNTVKAEMRHLFAKLGVQNRAGLIVRVFAEVSMLGAWPHANLPPQCCRCRATPPGGTGKPLEPSPVWVNPNWR
jgi:DNA-binding NarL/FixJ family response regulator